MKTVIWVLIHIKTFILFFPFNWKLYLYILYKIKLIGTHKFKYALLPHIGSFNESNVVEEGYKFNVPLVIK